MNSGKNHAIEFYKILATLVICTHHFHSFGLTYNNLAVFVEFFFILSGYFLMLSYDRERTHSCSDYGKKRFLRLYPEYLAAYGCLLLQRVLLHESLEISTIVPELLLLKSVGIFYTGYNYVCWYVCTLFWGEVLLYCLIACRRELVTHFIAPFLVIFGYAWLFNSGRGTGTLEIWDSFYPMLRALCGLSLGVLVYEARRSGCMSGMKLWMGTVLEVISIAVIVYSVTTNRNLWALAILSFVFLALVTVQRKGYLSAAVLDRKIFGALNTVTYGMYLNQVFMINAAWFFVPSGVGIRRWAFYYAGLVMMALCIRFVIGKVMANIGGKNAEDHQRRNTA